MGPTEVLLPYIVKNDLHGVGATLGLVFAAGGVGAIGSALVMGQRGSRDGSITLMYATWTVATLAVAGYGLATATWQLMVACLALQRARDGGHDRLGDAQAAARAGRAAGRVSSLDWLISIGLLPLSFALTAPVAAPIGRGQP